MKKISIIGLGFVGLPTFLILSNLKKKQKFIYQVTGIEKNNTEGKLIEKKFGEKKKWLHSSDPEYNNLFKRACSRKDSKITTNIDDIKDSKIIIISISFDFFNNKNPLLNLKNLCKKIFKKIKKKSLVIFETTFPPGTFDKVIIPIFKNSLKVRKMKFDDIYLSYSYERVTPGKNYINSIISNYRCYSGINKLSKQKCNNFFRTFINYKKYPLTEFDKIIDCETSKVLENSYRATNIALIDEWNKTGQVLKVDLNKIIKSIRLRNTHSNMMWPGLGVGGYCLTKDPYFLNFSMKNYFNKKISLPIINQTKKINNNMEKSSFSFIKSKISNLKNKKILICGVSYKADVADLRNSPSFKLIKLLEKSKAKISLYDPYFKSNKNFNKKIKFLKKFHTNYEIIIFCVAHKEFKSLNIYTHGNFKIFDLNMVLTDSQIDQIKNKKISFYKFGSFNEK